MGSSQSKKTDDELLDDAIGGKLDGFEDDGPEEALLGTLAQPKDATAKELGSFAAADARVIDMTATLSRDSPSPQLIIDLSGTIRQGQRMVLEPMIQEREMGKILSE
jgi:hypothetical protein